MPSISENLQRLISERGIAQKRLSADAGLGETVVRDIIKGHSQSPRYSTIAKLAAALGVDTKEITEGRQVDAPQNTGSIEPVRYSARADLPVYESAQGGPGGMVITYEPIEFIRRPDFLEHVKDAFAFYVIGDSMSPRFEQGERLLVHPKRPPRPGRDVLVVFKNGDGPEHNAMVKRLVKIGPDNLTLKQFNPPKVFDVDMARVSNIFTILGIQYADD